MQWRPVDWAWQKAKELVERSKNFENEDPLVQELCKVLTFEGSEEELFAAHPAVGRAYKIFSRPSDAANLHIRCGILGGATSEQIAAFAGLSPEIVAAYEKLFFDARPYFEAPKEARDGLILRAIFGETNPLTDKLTMQHVLMQLAYRMGWRAYSELFWGLGPMDVAARFCSSLWQLREMLKAVVSASLEKPDAQLASEYRMSKGGSAFSAVLMQQTSPLEGLVGTFELKPLHGDPEDPEQLKFERCDLPNLQPSEGEGAQSEVDG